ncbi:MAG: VWA domain-containing protein [Bryobacteraceae bacterium]
MKPEPAQQPQPPADAAKAAPAGVSSDSSGQNTVFRSSSALVRINTQVLRAGRAVGGLAQADFLVLDEREPVPLAAFGRDSEPLQVILLFDVSGSMSKILVEMAAAAEKALASLHPEDQVAVLVFGRRMLPLLDPTNDRRAAARMIQESPLERDVGAGSNLNGAILETLDWLSKQQPFAGRRSLIVLTDNKGMHYQTPDEKVLRSLAGMDVTLNAIVSPDARPPKPVPPGADANPDFTPLDVFRLAKETGGDVFRADRAGGRFIEMMERVRLRYDLAIHPQAGPDGSFRRLEVRLTDAARARLGKVEIRARTGYYTLAPAP